MRFALPALLLAFAASDAHAWWGHHAWRHHHHAWHHHAWHSHGWYYPTSAYPVYWAPVYYPAPMAYYVMPAESCPTTPMPAPRVNSMEHPAPMPEKKPAEKGSGATPATPYSPIIPATMSAPIEEKPENRLPKIDVPTTPKVELPTMKVDTPKMELPKTETPRIELPKAEPSKLELPPINAPAPKLELPPLPEIKLEKSTSKFRPALSAELFKVDGTPPADGSYRVNIFNTSDRAVSLTVNGAAVTLPAKNTITAAVRRSFEWSVGDEPATKSEIPADAAGAEVVIK